MVISGHSLQKEKIWTEAKDSYVKVLCNKAKFDFLRVIVPGKPATVVFIAGSHNR